MRLLSRLSFAALLLVFASSSSQIATAQLAPLSKVSSRLSGPIGSSTRAVIAGTKSPRTANSRDLGAVAPGMEIHGISLVFAKTPAQEADLKQLIADQQNQSSPVFHQWLTPQQFGARFGMSDADLAKATDWLQSQGFTIDSIANSRDRIRFSGTASQVEASLGTAIHHFADGTDTNFAPVSDVSLPAELANITLAVGNLTDYRVKPHVRFQSQVNPNFTSGTSGNHFLTPKDVATIYDVNPVYNAGFTGAGYTIAVIGQSAIVTTDITNFQSAAGVSVRAPTLVLMPGSGTSTVYTGDEGESDLDLEYTSGMAPGATIKFLYTGNGSLGVFDALEYGIQSGLAFAPILSLSYGSCELLLSSSTFSQFDSVLAQASTQGQTVIISAGDSGSTSCNGFTSLTTAQQETLNVSFPVDSQYVTGLGGSEFTAAAVVSTNSTYWTNTAGTDVISSALSYMPEMVWNDDSTSGLSSGGGGISTLESRPTWQTGVPGIPTGTTRLVPDISLASSPNNAGYLYCTSDSQSTGSTTGSCVHGFRDTNNSLLTVAGGTSFAAPVFAGMLAVMSQKLAANGLGNINPKLYSLASNSTTYASAFHDITVGGNQCKVTTCSTGGASAYAAGTGYDEASGLGSIDMNNLLNAWVASLVTTVAPTATVTLTPSTITVGSTDAFSVLVSGTGATPTGTVQFQSAGTNIGAVQTLASGRASLTSPAYGTAGTYAITAIYTPDTASASTYSTVTSAAQTLTVSALPVPTVALTLTPTAITVGNTDAFSVVVSGSGATPTGTVQFKSAGTNIGSAQTLVAGRASLTSTAYNAAGTFAITATYTPDTASSTVYAANTSAAQTLTVNTIATTTSLSFTSPINVGTAPVFTSTVTPASGTGTPTGTVSFYYNSGTTAVASGTLVNGTVTVTGPTTTSVGSSYYSAAYAPDSASLSTYAISASAQKILVTNPVPGFTITPTGSIAVTAGASTGNTATVSVASGVLPNFAAGFAGTVNLTCQATATFTITVAPVCAVTPASVAVTATTPATATITITTIAPHAKQSTTQQSSLRGFGTATLAGLLMLCLPLARRRRNWRSLAAVLFCAAAFAGLSGCGGNTTPAPGKTGGTTTGPYVVVVTGTSGTLTQTATINLTVN